MGRFIGRLHRVSAGQSFQHRIHLNPQTYGFDPYEFLIEQNFIPDYLKPNFCKTVERRFNKKSNRYLKTWARLIKYACTVIVMQEMCYGAKQAHILSIWTIASWARQYRIFGCYFPVNRNKWKSN